MTCLNGFLVTIEHISGLHGKCWAKRFKSESMPNNLVLKVEQNFQDGLELTTNLNFLSLLLSERNHVHESSYSCRWFRYSYK